MGKRIKVCYKDKDSDLSDLKAASLDFKFEIEFYKDYCYYLLDESKKVKRSTSGRTYNIGDYLIFQRSNQDNFDAYKIVEFLPDDCFLVRIKSIQ